MKIKLLTLFSFLFLITIQSFGQENPERTENINQAKKYRNLKRIGIVTTAVSGAVAIGGVASLLTAAAEWANNTSNVNERTYGEAAFIVGSAGLIVGIPLWIKNGHKQKEYKNRSVRLNVNLRKNGFVLTYRF